MKIKFYPLTDTKPEVVNNFYADSEVEVYEILAEDDDERLLITFMQIQRLKSMKF